MLPDILNYIPDPKNGRPIADGQVYFFLGGYSAPSNIADVNSAFIAEVTASGNPVPQPIFTSKGGTLIVGSQTNQPQLNVDPLVKRVAVYDKCGRLVYSTAYNGVGAFVDADALAATDSTVPVGGVEARAFRAVDGIKNLLTVANVAQTVTGFYAGTDIGGGDFVYRPALDKNQHNGVTVIAPEALAAWGGTYADIDTLFNWAGAGSGCFVRAHSIPLAIPEVQITWAGASPAQDSTKSIQKLVNMAQGAFDVASGDRQFCIFVPNGRYFITSEIFTENAFNFILRGNGKRYGSGIQVSPDVPQSSPLWSMFRFGSGFVGNIQIENLELAVNDRAVFAVDHTNKGQKPFDDTGWGVTYSNVMVTGIKDGGGGVRGLSYDAKMNNCDLSGFGTSPANAGEWRGVGVTIYDNSNMTSFKQTWFRRLSHAAIADPLAGGSIMVQFDACLFDNIRRSAYLSNRGAKQIVFRDSYFEAVNDGGTENEDLIQVGGQSGTEASATATVSGGRITSVTVTNGGSGYTLAPFVVVNSSDGFGARLKANVSGGAVTSIEVLNGGWHYTTPTLTVRDVAVSISATVIAAALPLDASFTYVQNISLKNNIWQSGNSRDILALSGFHKATFTDNRVAYRGGTAGTSTHEHAVRVFGYGVGTTLLRSAGRTLLMEGNDYYSNTANRLKPSVDKLFTGVGSQSGNRFLNGIVIKDRLNYAVYANLDTLLDTSQKSFLESSPTFTAAYTDATEGVLRVTKDATSTPSTIDLRKHLPKVRGDYIRLELTFTGSTAGVNPRFEISDGVKTELFEPGVSVGNLRAFSAPFYVDPNATTLTLSYTSFGGSGTYHDFISLNLVPCYMDSGCGREVR